VRSGSESSFVVADIPGLIEGASDGAGLGIQFLKHLERCRLLLHIIDICPFDQSDPAESAMTIVNELQQFSPELAEKPRWLVFNKADLVLEEEADEVIEKVTQALEWEGSVYCISAFQNDGTELLCQNIAAYLDTLPKQFTEGKSEPEKVEFKWDRYHTERLQQEDENWDDDDWDDEDDGVEIIYRE
jgi:GTP-binding protein